MATHIINLYNNRQRAKRALVSNQTVSNMNKYLIADKLLKREIYN